MCAAILQLDGIKSLLALCSNDNGGVQVGAGAGVYSCVNIAILAHDSWVLPHWCSCAFVPLLPSAGDGAARAGQPGVRRRGGQGRRDGETRWQAWPVSRGCGTACVQDGVAAALSLCLSSSSRLSLAPQLAPRLLAHPLVRHQVGSRLAKAFNDKLESSRLPTIVHQASRLLVCLWAEPPVPEVRVGWGPSDQRGQGRARGTPCLCLHHANAGSGTRIGARVAPQVVTLTPTNAPAWPRLLSGPWLLQEYSLRGECMK